eukprot:4709813-Amphidinium_carterae.1
MTFSIGFLKSLLDIGFKIANVPLAQHGKVAPQQACPAALPPVLGPHWAKQTRFQIGAQIMQ